MFSATRVALVSGFLISMMEQRTFLPYFLVSSSSSFLMSSPPRPTTMPGRAHWIMILISSFLRSISIAGTPASYRRFFRSLRIL